MAIWSRILNVGPWVQLQFMWSIRTNSDISLLQDPRLTSILFSDWTAFIYMDVDVNDAHLDTCLYLSEGFGIYNVWVPYL